MLRVTKNAVSLHRSKQSWCRSSVWLECLPVTQEVDGSSPFGTAKSRDDVNRLFFMPFFSLVPNFLSDFASAFIDCMYCQSYDFCDLGIGEVGAGEKQHL